MKKTLRADWAFSVAFWQAHQRWPRRQLSPCKMSAIWPICNGV